MDQQEASQRWCPWRPLEYVKPGVGIANYPIDDGFSLGTASRCVTFDCMAWRDNECVRLKVPNAPGKPTAANEPDEG